MNRNRIARLDSTSGNVESTFNPNVNGPVNALALLPNGLILLGGSFSAVSGTNVARAWLG